MTQFPRPIAVRLSILCGAALLLASGFVHGRLTHRWTPPAQLARAVQRLGDLPTAFGPWRVHESAPLPDPTLQMLKCAGYVNRTYAHADTGEKVAATIVLGVPGTIWPHTPQGCYPEETYTALHPPRRIEIAGDRGIRGSFWLIAFRSRQSEDRVLCVAYAWSTGGEWSAPNSPRMAFGGSAFLYKVQIACFAPQDDPSDVPETCRRFLQDVLPVAQQHLVPANVFWNSRAGFPTATAYRTHSAGWRTAFGGRKFARLAPAQSASAPPAPVPIEPPMSPHKDGVRAEHASITAYPAPSRL